MKRILLTAAIIAATLSSCSQNEVITSNLDNQAIGFGVYTGANTKSGEVTTTTLATYGFGVFGYYDAFDTASQTAADFNDATSTPNFMYNQVVNGANSSGTIITDYTQTASTWNYTPLKYWPNNTTDMLTFFAYGPHSDNVLSTDCITFAPVTAGTSDTDASGTNSKTAMVGIPVITYTLGADASSVDFVAAAPVYEQKNESNYNVDNGTMSFNFEHLLTRAKFSAYLDATSLNSASSDTVTDKDGSDYAADGTGAAGDGVYDNVDLVYHDSTRVYVTKLVILGDHSSSASGNTITTYYDKAGAAIELENGGFYTSNTFTYVDDDNTSSIASGYTIAVAGIGGWADSPTASADDYSLEGVMDITTTAWADTRNNVACSFTPNGVDVYDKSYEVDGSAVGATELFATNTGSGQEYLFLLPPNGSTGIDDNSKVYLYIEYDVVTLDPNLDKTYSQITNRDVITLPTGSLKLGSAYNFVLTIGMDEVKVEATVEPWNTDDDYQSVVTPSTTA
ncbi:MAG: fimbrillin family protein [Rikenellaceae bacterium]